jgi:hypothetical protein
MAERFFRRALFAREKTIRPLVAAGEIMKLEITLTKNILRKKFDPDDKYNKLRDRIDRHKLALSNELFEVWEKDARENGYQQYFMDWYFSIIGTGKKLRKFKIDKIRKVRGTRSKEDEVLLKTAIASNDKIIAGNVNPDMIKRNNKVSIISEEVFSREKRQTVTTEDVENVLTHKDNSAIFDIYETPVRLVVNLDSDSELLGKYLSKFIIGTKKLYIKDKYITQFENERNINEYILKYLNKKETKLVFLFPEERKDSKGIVRFRGYEGFNTEFQFLDSKLMHHSSLETDRYVIDLGYRLRVFGGEEDGKTEQEIINITKK